MLKLLRRVEPGIHPEVEILAHLNRSGSPTRRSSTGTLQYANKGPRRARRWPRSSVHRAATSEAYSVVVDQAAQFLDWALAVPDAVSSLTYAPSLGIEALTARRSSTEGLSRGLAFAELLGRRTAELHIALADSSEPRLRPEVFNAHAQRSMYQAMRTEAAHDGEVRCARESARST